MRHNFYIGIMSGTSLDAIDATLVYIHPKSTCELINSVSIPMPSSLKKELLNLNEPGKIANEFQAIKEAEYKITLLYFKAYKEIINQTTQLKKNPVFAIGAHGQTIRHQPNANPPYTTQLLNGALLSELSQTNVVCDFRSRDIAAGGQGAPLAPVFHKQLFSLTSPYAIVNLGGIANISLISDDTITGFDCGPANCLMDCWIQKHHNKNFDINGQWAKTGKLLPKLLEQLINDKYILSQPPKSTGRDHFSLSWLENQLRGTEKTEDVMLTLVHFTAKTIANDIPSETSSICFVGGGAKNTLLINTIANYLADQNKKAIAVDSPIDPQMIESAGFAYLSYLSLNNQTADVSSVTGCNRSHILGAIYPY